MNKFESYSFGFLAAFFASCLASYLFDSEVGPASLPVISLWMTTALLAVNLIVRVSVSLLQAAFSKHQNFG